ncbi:MAG: NYN domain-containing protein [Desulfobacterales bacterium]|nr:NYN domain-containing protein [Desulfobacterales bacterium]
MRDAKYARFDIGKVLEQLLLKGSIVVKKAYCDWERYKEFKAPMHEASFELIEIPHVRMSGKNSADIRMVVDALDLCYTKSHVDTFVIVSGDSDFSPLVSKLRENNKLVIGVGVKSSTSDLLIANCDEFIYYDDLVRKDEQRRGRRKAPAKQPRRRPRSRQRGGRSAGAAAPAPRQPAAGVRGAPVREAPKTEDEKKQEAFDLVLATIEALAEDREEDEKIWGSMIKQALKRQRPGFNETYHGFRSFSQLLEEAQRAQADRAREGREVRRLRRQGRSRADGRWPEPAGDPARRAAKRPRRCAAWSAQYARPDRRKALWQLANTLPPFVALWTLAALAARVERAAGRCCSCCRSPDSTSGCSSSSTTAGTARSSRARDWNRAVGRGARPAHVLPVRVLAQDARDPPRHLRQPRPARPRRHPDADGARVPVACRAPAHRLPALPQHAGAARHRPALPVRDQAPRPVRPAAVVARGMGQRALEQRWRSRSRGSRCAGCSAGRRCWPCTCRCCWSPARPACGSSTCSTSSSGPTGPGRSAGARSRRRWPAAPSTTCRAWRTGSPATSATTTSTISRAACRTTGCAECFESNPRLQAAPRLTLLGSLRCARLKLRDEDAGTDECGFRHVRPDSAAENSVIARSLIARSPAGWPPSQRCAVAVFCSLSSAATSCWYPRTASSSALDPAQLAQCLGRTLLLRPAAHGSADAGPSGRRAVAQARLHHLEHGLAALGDDDTFPGRSAIDQLAQAGLGFGKIDLRHGFKHTLTIYMVTF